MDKNLAHTLKQLNDREIKFSQTEIEDISLSCDCDSAVILGKDFYLGDKCNIILIVRRKNPITIMYRRLSQKLNCSQLNVDKIINLI